MGLTGSGEPPRMPRGTVAERADCNTLDDAATVLQVSCKHPLLKSTVPISLSYTTPY